MKHTRLHIIRIFTLLLLLQAGGTANQAWGQVTYYILTKPFNVRNAANDDNYKTNIRLEALRCTSTGTTVYLPAGFRSPLAKNFKYWKTPTVTNTKLYDDNGTNPKVLQTTYDIYTAVSDEMTEGSTLESNGNPTAIYVTYDYAEDNTILKLDGTHKYNIQLNSGNNLRYLCFNKNRNNRPGAAKATTVSADDLVSDDFVTNVNGIGNNTTSQLHFQFYLCGADPYNITIKTAYKGSGTYNESLEVEKNTNYKKPYAGSTIFAKLQSNADNNGTANMWLSPDAHRHYKSKTDATFFDSWEGFYKSNMNPIFNAVAVLPKGTGYIFVASKLNQNNIVYQPNGSGNYAVLTDDGNNPRMIFKPLDNAVPMEPEPVKTYTYYVTTPFSNLVSATAEWSDAYADDELDEARVPVSLKRKYCSIVGFYKDAALTQKITKYSEATEGNIYIKYEVSGAPFTAIDPSADYTTATWYELTDKDSSGKKIRWDATNSVYKNNGGASTYEKESEFAFVGDPYELRVLYRKGTEDYLGKRYVGAATVSAGNTLGFSDTDGEGYKWEIPYDETTGNFVLRQYGSGDTTPMYWQWNTSNTSEGNNIVINTTSTRIKVKTLPTYTYIYNIVDLAGNIAIQGTAEQTIFTNLNGYASIPEVIRSPFLADETITFYDNYTDRNKDDKVNRLDWHNDKSGASEQPPITQTPGTNNANIYVAYTTTHLSSKSIQLIYSQEFNVKLNGEYIYWNSAAGDDQNKILSENLSSDDAKLAETPYLWHLRGRDPYCMRIDNRGYSENKFGSPTSTTTTYMYDPVGNGTGSDQTINNGMFVQVHDKTWADNQALDFVDNRDDGSRFIAMLSSSAGGVYEVLAATGSTDYYRIGRESTTGAETKIYSNAHFAHGADQLRFELASTTLISYHLIDKSKNEIFKDEISSKNPRLTLPADYVSPLVEEYYYYPTLDKAITDLEDDRITELSDDDGDHHIYVTYKVSNEIGFGTSHPHMLKFYNGQSYHMEDGLDKLTTSVASPKPKIKAVYPYCNGDGNLNIYGSAMNEEQMAGGASTRSRWVWFFESDNNDPYHVKIHSKNTVSFNGAPNSTYIQTYAVHFDQDTDKPNKQRVVTGANFPGISGNVATEYAVLGVTGRYKLLTINKIAADLDGDGNRTGDGENERRYVTSFEQYWKTYNMVRQYVLEDPRVDKDDPERFNDPIIMPSERWSELKTKLTALGVDDEANRVDGCSWHSYEAIATAIRWNGYSDKSGSDGYEKKKVERLQHWYQTFDMGNGEFDIESANIPSVLVLLDRHGWEIMRKPIPTGSDDPETATKLAALRAYDSPMVKEYKFYSNADKVSNCHKYELRMQNGAERDPIKVNGKQFISTSLATLPSYVADRDLFVTYTVKEEYDKSYKYTLNYQKEDDGSYTIISEIGTPSAFIVLQNYKYASDEGTSSITANTVDYSTLSQEIIADAPKTDTKRFKDKTLWYVQPNLDIDNEMGIPWPWSMAASGSNSHEWKETKVLYKDKTGFDPYNLQLVNKSTGKYFTTHMTDSKLSEGAYNGIYSGEGGSKTVTLAGESSGFVASSESYDHSHLKITNQTFMAVQDINGNMQIMPRFDHNHRIDAFAMLEEPKTRSPKAGVDDLGMGEQTTFMIRPVVYDYHILDNNGNTAMRYRTGGELYPSMPEHFKSPLAEDFRFYSGSAAHSTPVESTEKEWKDATGVFQQTATDDEAMMNMIDNLTTSGTYYFKIGSSTYKQVIYNASTTTSSDGIYSDVANKKDISNREITGSFAAAGLKDNADIFIRYTYNDNYDTDHDNILQGQWLTMKLNSLDVQASGTVVTADNPETEGVDEKGTGVWLYGTTKPADAATLKTSTQWHWKFLQSPNAPILPDGNPNPLYVAPDPYAVRISNRSANYDEDPTANPNKMGTAIKVGTVDRFVILAHGDDYALVKADDDADHFYFLNGDGMTEPDAGTLKAASMVEEAGFSSTSPTISNAAKIQFTDDILHTFTYHVITNAKAKAATASPTDDEFSMYGFTPYLPGSIQSPLIREYDYIYYGSASGSGSVYTVVDGTQINTLYGLYDDVVYVRYPAFDSDKTPYFVPNKKGTSGGHVAKHTESNDVAIDITGKMPYNIIWYNDNMMASDGSTISDGGSQTLTGGANYTWYFDGGDPYALHIKKSANKYIDASAGLSSTPQDFMLLKKDGYDYGVFAKTGGKDYMLSFGTLADPSGTHKLSISTTAPNKFVPFALSTHKLVYHLVIGNTGTEGPAYINIPYREGTESDPSSTLKTEPVLCTTQRDLTSNINGVPGDKYQLGDTYMGQTYCVDAGQVSIGDELVVPTEFDRPNCKYFYYIDNIQTAGLTGTYQKTVSSESEMETGIAALAAEGDYYYKITGQYIYRKVKVTTANDGVNNAVYEISGSTASEYSGASSSLTATDAADLKTKADALDATDDYYYAVGPMDLYKRAHVTSVLPLEYSVVDCTNDEWANCWQDDTGLNSLYKGLKVTKMMSDSELVGSVVKVNVTYAFDTGLETNAGDGFVTSVGDNLWYTFETKDGPHLAHYTNAWGLQAMEGRDTRYTNDYLWTPLGDVYGFKMYNRYVYKTSNETTRVMTTESFTEGKTLKMAVPGGTITNEDGIVNVPVPEGNEVYELLATPDKDGYFYIHPVINDTGTKYYIKRNTVAGAKQNYAILSTTPTEWTFGLYEDLLKPYYDRAGYVGGLTTTAEPGQKSGKQKYEEAEDLMEKQAIVYDDANIVKYKPGYYRLHNQPGVSGLTTVRYASGYLHKIEKTAVSGGIPMHFYSRKGVNTTFEGEGGLGTGFTKTVATRGVIPVPATEYDPSTIFYFSGNTILEGNPRSTMQTQGLYVAANPNGDAAAGTTTSKLQRAVMSENQSDAITVSLMDIGGAVLLIHDGGEPAARVYLNYDQSLQVDETKMIYDLKYYHDSPTDDAKWCMEPVNNQGLMIETNDGGDGYFYSTFFAPFDVALPEDNGSNKYYAYVCNAWNTENIHPNKVPEKTISEKTYFAGEFVPAGTPVIIRTTDNTGKIKLTLPTNTPAITPVSCIFTGENLEQLLTKEVTAEDKVYAFGLPITGYTGVTYTSGATNGEIENVVGRDQADKGVGFYINATQNKEKHEERGQWTPNNRYVLHNKIYYREEPSPTRELSMRGIEFVPVIFDDDLEGGELPGEEEQNPSEGVTLQGDGCIYDLMGRKVATRQQVEDGSWRLLRPGIYILNGKKFRH